LISNALYEVLTQCAHPQHHMSTTTFSSRVLLICFPVVSSRCFHAFHLACWSADSAFVLQSATMYLGTRVNGAVALSYSASIVDVASMLWRIDSWIAVDLRLYISNGQSTNTKNVDTRHEQTRSTGEVRPTKALFCQSSACCLVFDK
jgi:hypothetical protein